MRIRRLLAIVLLVFALLIPVACTAKPALIETFVFDGEEAMKHVVELAGPKYEGRLPGTPGNILAAEYIAGVFAGHSLMARGDDNTYYQWYEQPTSAYPQPFAVEILKPNGSLEKSFRYRYDFIEANASTGYSVNATVDAANCTVSASESTILVTDPLGVTATTLIIGRAPLSGLGDNRASMFIRTGRLQSEGYPTILVTPEVFESIASYLSDGYLLRLSGEVDYPIVTVPNVVAHLPAFGTPEASLIIAAHFDHFGMDFTGEINSGAVDNASGVAVMLELARFLSQEQLPIDFSFVAFNGEERGLLGARHYQQAANIVQGTKVINIDTVGLAESEYTFLLYHGSGRRLASELDAIYKEHGQEARSAPSTRADHAPFGERGYEAVSIVQMNQHYFDNEYHTPYDTIDLISASSLQQVGQLVLDYISQYAP